MKIKKSAVILSGGKNSRMEYKTKAFLKFQHKTFIEIILESLREYEEIIISCNDLKLYKDLEKRYNIKLVKDEIKSIGPIGGIYSALRNARFERCLVVAADMPFLYLNFLNYLGSMDFKGDALIPISCGKVQPLCGVYDITSLECIDNMILKKEYKIKVLLERLNTEYIKFNDNETTFLNINTPKEYQKLNGQYD
jgi:molybdopterin-guanine dinucleotide biosynthesis protein A